MEVNAEFQNNREPEPRDVLLIDESPLPGTQNQPSTFRRQLSQYFAAFVVNILAFNYGISEVWLNSALPLLNSEDTPLSSGPLSDMDRIWLYFGFYIAALISVPTFGAYYTVCSGKLIGYIISCIYLTSWIIVSFTHSLVLVYIARCLAGIGVGGTLLYVPLYVSEIAEDNIRGTLGCLFLFFNYLGNTFGYIIGKYISYYTQPLIYLAISATFMALFYLIPETPFYLLRRRTTSEAITALKKLRGGDNYDVTDDISRLKETFRSATSNRSLIKMYLSRGIIMGAVLSSALFVNQQLSGNVIFSLAIFIFYDSDLNLSPEVAANIGNILQLLGIFLSCIFVELFGRKILLLVSNLIVVFELVTLGIYFYLHSINVDVSSWSWYPLKCLFFYKFFFSIGLGPLPFVIMTELLPVHIRSIGASVALCSRLIVDVIAQMVFYFVLLALKDHGCWVFTGCCILGTVFVRLFIPETKSRKIEEITHDLNY